ncbi:hypothetical protein AVEN_175056-1 [Araneus ventricosus]|uniref:Uncharacterized protein n=1 Tax=Araneus ventricosus TaxID=182803 RepID=A0A4Y2MKR6_ARAVE|nr:hypothetical protein AVEN_175056-1 [Araneus ventricosus]
MSANAFFGFARSTVVTRYWICLMSEKRRPFRTPLRWGNKKKSAGARSGEYEGCSRNVTLRGSASRGSQCADGRCRGAVSTAYSCTTMLEPTGYVAAAVSKLPRRIQR